MAGPILQTELSQMLCNEICIYSGDGNNKEGQTCKRSDQAWSVRLFLEEGKQGGLCRTPCFGWAAVSTYKASPMVLHMIFQRHRQLQGPSSGLHTSMQSCHLNRRSQRQIESRPPRRLRRRKRQQSQVQEKRRNLSRRNGHKKFVQKFFSQAWEAQIPLVREILQSL